MKYFFLAALVALFMGFFTTQTVFAESAKHAHASCASECNKCAEACEKALEHVQKKGGKFAAAENINALKDCIALCKASADLKSRNSSLSAKISDACADACKKCAVICADMKDGALKDCIEQCNKCAEACTETMRTSLNSANSEGSCH